MKLHLPKLHVPGRRDPVSLYSNHAELVQEIIRLGGRRPIGGGAAQFLTNPTNPAALGAAAATVLGPLLGLEQIAFNLAVAWIPNVTGITAAAAVTTTIRRTDTPAVIGTAVVTNSGAGASAVGPIICLALVPFGIPAANGIDCQMSASAGAGQPVFTTTGAPAFLAMLGIA